MRRSLAILMCSGLLLALLPGTAAAGRVTKYHDHHVGFFCDTPIDGGYATASIDSSSAFGDFAGADVWLDPAVPFEDPSSITGNTETVSITEGTTEVQFSATFDAFDGDGAPLGSALLEATMTPVGAPQPITGESNGNHHSNTAGTFQELEGDATLTLAGDVLQIHGCDGDITDISVLENSPHSSVSKNAEINIGLFLADVRGLSRVLRLPGSVRVLQRRVPVHRGPEPVRHGWGDRVADDDIADRVDPSRRRDHGRSVLRPGSRDAHGQRAARLLDADELDEPRQGHRAGPRAGRSARVLNGTDVRPRPGALPHGVVQQQASATTRRARRPGGRPPPMTRPTARSW